MTSRPLDSLRTPGLPTIHSTAGCSRSVAGSRRRPLIGDDGRPARPTPAGPPAERRPDRPRRRPRLRGRWPPAGGDRGPRGRRESGIDRTTGATRSWRTRSAGCSRGRATRTPPWPGTSAADGCLPDGCFPARLEEIEILEAAQAANPGDARAPYYLGNLLYDRRRYDDAIASWERARRLDPSFPTVHRNLGIAEANVRRRPVAARRSYLRAFAADSTDGRVLYELDQLLKRQNAPPERRLARLQGHRDLVDARDDLGIEYATLLDQLDRPADALAYLEGRRFHPWEGGEGLALGAYVAVRVRLAREALVAGAVATALQPSRGRADAAPVARRGAPSPGTRTRDPIRARSGCEPPHGDDAGAREAWTLAARPLADGSVLAAATFFRGLGAPSARS